MFRNHHLCTISFQQLKKEDGEGDYLLNPLLSISPWGWYPEGLEQCRSRGVPSSVSLAGVPECWTLGG